MALSSCALLSTGPEYDNKRLEDYIQGSGYKASDLPSLKKHLSRNTKMAGDIYRLKAYPYTQALVDAIVDDQAAALSLTEKQRKEVQANLEKKYLNRKTCFQFEYQVTRVEKASQLKDWSLELTDGKDVTYKTQWQKDSFNDIPTKSYTFIGSIREPVWYGQGVACTQQEADLSNDFELKTIAKYSPFPFSTESTLSWDYPEYEVVDGKEVEVETKSKNYKGYRGW